MTVANPRVPFLDYQSFAAEEPETTTIEPRSSALARSPFISVYELDGRQAESTYDDPVREAYASLVDELHDDEFDEALFELQSHVRALHDEHLSAGASRPEADRLVSQHFSQLIRESEAMVDAMAHEFADREESGIADHEFETFVEGYLPSVSLEPEFEGFFGKLVSKVGKLAKAAAGSAWQGIKNVALRPIFNALKSVIKPILQGVLQRAIGQLPEPLRPAAQNLAIRLGLASPPPAPPAPDPATAGMDPSIIPGLSADSVQAAVGSDAPGVQQELDEQLAATLLAHDEVDLNMETAQLRATSSGSANPVFAELDDARERFIQRLGELKQGESAGPAVEEFIPAVMAAARIAIKVIGRDRVVKFLGGMLDKLISRLIGPEQSKALSIAIADAGLRAISMELPESASPALAASAVAATVEETIGRVASLPEYVLDNQELLEGYALEAFERAAAANLPALFSPETYRQRPELLEAGVNAGWILLPLRGRKRYKRCTRTFKVRVSPHMASEVESFEGTPLSDHLQDRFGMADGEDVEAELNLYEALPGTSLEDIARGERETLGSGLSDSANAAQLHPLTPQAAAVLLGKPGMGRSLGAASNNQSLAAGQRFYHLGLGGRRPFTVPGSGHGRHGHRRHRLRRLLQVGVTLDRPRDRVRVCIFLSEVKAQKLALRMRDGSNLGALCASFQRWIGRRLDRIFLGHAPGKLRVVHPGLRPGPVSAQSLADLPARVHRAFRARLNEWLVRGFAEFAKAQSSRLVAATEHAADGVTLRFIVEHPPGLKEYLRALADHGASAAAVGSAVAAGEQPSVRVEVSPGHRCG